MSAHRKNSKSAHSGRRAGARSARRNSSSIAEPSRETPRPVRGEDARLKILSTKLRHKAREAREYGRRLRESEAVAASARDALKASLDREKLTLAFAEIGTCEFDLRSRMVRASEMALRLFGLKSGQPDISFERLLHALHPEDRPRFEQMVRQCIDGTASLDIEFRVGMGDQSHRWLRTKGDALLDLEGEPIKVLWVTEDVSQRKDMDARVRFLAHHDLLTGLPNRTLFQDRLQQAIAAAKRMQTRIAVLFVDLDRFKSINDSFGHRAGDALLQSVAARLRRCVRETDTVCRHSGDEYLIVLSALREPGEAGIVASKVIQSFDKGFMIEDQEVSISASVGISVFPDDGQTGEDLIRNADAAMYHSKRNGRNRFEFSGADRARRRAAAAGEPVAAGHRAQSAGSALSAAV